MEDKIICPDCKSEIKVVTNCQVGDILECQECGTEVEVVGIKPLKISELFEEK